VEERQRNREKNNDIKAEQPWCRGGG